MAAISLHHWVDVTLSQSKAQCLLTSFRQTAQVIFFLLILPASQLHVGKKIVTTSQQFALPRLGKWKQFLFRYCCLTAIKHRTTRSVLFPNIVWLQRNFLQCREKSIFCMQCICNVHCNYVVAHAYNTVAKIRSSSGWAFWYVLRALRLAQDFGNVLASSCCTGSFSGVTTISSKWSTLT
jgi:hypothetical protein